MSEFTSIWSGLHSIDYGTNHAGTSAEDTETSPLLQNMEEGKIGMSQQALVGGKPSRLIQYMAGLIVTLGGAVSGTCLGWTSPTGPLLMDDQQYGFPISSDQFGWISSLTAIGAICSTPITGALVNLVGRKNTILILVFPAVIGWALMIWAESVAMFCIGRFISGLAGGGYSIVVPLYTNEYTETAIRGAIGCMFQLQLNFGILFTYVFGAFLNVFWLTVLCGALPIVYGALMIFLPESPLYYLKTGRPDRARQSLQWFRGSGYDVEPELSVMQKNLEIIENERIPITQAFSTVAAKKALVIGVGVMLLQQLSGINSVIFYSTSIFAAAGSSIKPKYESIIIGVVAVVFTYISTLVVDRAGRRPLLLFSDCLMAICTFLLGVYFFLQSNTSFDVTSISFLPIMAVCVFLVAFNLGFGPIPWMFVTEVFPQQISGYAVPLCSCVNWLGVFLVTKFFDDINKAVGTFGSFWLYTIISGLGTVFVFFFVPETKNKSLEQIQSELEGRS